MGFVLSAEEMAEVRAVWSPPRFISEIVTIRFRTEPSFIADVLPPCFVPTERAEGEIMLARAAHDLYEYNYTNVGVEAQFGSVQGIYNLTMLLSTHGGAAVARDKWGEPKKYGVTELTFDGDTVEGHGYRDDVCLVAAHADFSDESAKGVEEPGSERDKVSSTALELKGVMSTEGAVFEEPKVVIRHADATVRARRVGKVQVELRGTESEPVDTIPILSVGPAVYTFGESASQTPEIRDIDTEPDYTPYVYGRSYAPRRGHLRADFRPLAKFAESEQSV